MLLRNLLESHIQITCCFSGSFSQSNVPIVRGTQRINGSLLFSAGARTRVADVLNVSTSETPFLECCPTVVFFFRAISHSRMNWREPIHAADVPLVK